MAWNTSSESLKVYDVLGQEVAVLVDEFQVAGFRSVTWNAGNMSSGVYFYRLSAASLSGQASILIDTRKLILIK